MSYCAAGGPPTGFTSPQSAFKNFPVDVTSTVELDVCPWALAVIVIWIVLLICVSSIA